MAGSEKGKKTPNTTNAVVEPEVPPVEETGAGDSGDLEEQLTAVANGNPESDETDDLDAHLANFGEQRGEMIDNLADEIETDQIPVGKAQFRQLHPSDEISSLDSIDRLLDVGLTLSVELGRKNIQIKDIIALGPGKIIELDKLAGEPVDLLVNGKLLAKGEVVVVDENFGVRITELINPADRRVL